MENGTQIFYDDYDNRRFFRKGFSCDRIMMGADAASGQQEYLNLPKLS